MPRVKLIDIDPANVSLTGFASNVTGAAFALTANDSGDGLAHQVSIRNDSGNDHAGKTITLVGTDPDGYPLTEVVTGPGASATVESSGYFLTLTSATPSATIGADTFDIGWVDEVCTRTIMLNRHADTGPLVQVNVTGTIDFTAQVTISPIRDIYAGQPSLAWIDTGTDALVTTATDVVSFIEAGAYACRFLVNSYTDTAEMQVMISEEAG